MKNKLVVLMFALFAIQVSAQQQLPDPVLLPNGWKLTPAGVSIPLGDLPLNMISNHSGTYVAVTNNGQSTQTLQLFDISQKKLLDEVVIPKSWYGLAFSSDDQYLFASGGHDNQILKYSTKEGKLHLVDSIVLGKPWPTKIGPAGITIDDKSKFSTSLLVRIKNCTL